MFISHTQVVVRLQHTGQCLSPCIGNITGLEEDGEEEMAEEVDEEKVKK